LRALEAQLAILHKKIEEHVVVLGDYESQNKRTASENGMLFTRYKVKILKIKMSELIHSEKMSRI